MTLPKLTTREMAQVFEAAESIALGSNTHCCVALWESYSPSVRYTRYALFELTPLEEKFCAFFGKETHSSWYWTPANRREERMLALSLFAAACGPK